MNCRSRVCLSTPIYTNHRYNYKTPDLFSLSRIFTDLIMHNYRSNQSALMTRCGTDFRHQYGIFGGKSQTSVSRNATRPGAKKDGCFRRLPPSPGNSNPFCVAGVWIFSGSTHRHKILPITTVCLLSRPEKYKKKDLETVYLPTFKQYA